MTAKQTEYRKELDAEKKAWEQMGLATGDPNAKRFGPAKDGGQWFKNYTTGQLYRVDKEYHIVAGKSKVKYGVVERRESKVPAHIQKAQAKIKRAKVSKEKKETKKAAAGPTRADLMGQAKDKGIKYFRILNREELQTVLGTTDQKVIDQTIEEAKKRWKDCDFFKKDRKVA